MWSFQDKEFVITNPRNFVFEVFEINVLLKPIDISFTKVFFVINCTYWVFLKFKDNKLAANYLFNWLNADVIFLLKSVWLRWVTIRLVSSANSTGLWLFPNTLARSFIYKRERSGPSMDPWGTPHLTLIHLEKLLWQEFLLVIDTLWYLFVR
jgi:hypothetical protein